MAKLNARGRTVKVEAVREYDETILQRAHDRYERSYKADYADGSDPSLTIWERCTRRLMSDGTILEKRDVRFRPANPPLSWEDPKGRYYSYGWKVHGKLKQGLTPDDFARICTEPRKDGSPSVWTVSRSGFMPAKVISQRRLIAAVQSGESIGFCTSCGAEQSGVDPDANGYQCQGCGQMSVTGAEELLMQSA